ncbi:hypothetical protein GCM10029976_050390 [Kribbella albertanoniae]
MVEQDAQERRTGALAAVVRGDDEFGGAFGGEGGVADQVAGGLEAGGFEGAGFAVVGEDV